MLEIREVIVDEGTNKEAINTVVSHPNEGELIAGD